MREKDLETSRKETERKLVEANFETKQVCLAVKFDEIFVP